MSDNRIAEVTQADRDAFIDYEKNTSIGLNPTFCAAIRAGDHDADRRIQAFARHRTAASQASDVRTALEKCIALIDDMSRFVGQTSLKDYALFNEAPMLAQKALATLTAPPTSDAGLTCDDCKRANPVWFAPNEVWNLVMGGPEAVDDPGGVIFPTCFISRAEKIGMVPTGWKLAPEEASPPTSGEALTQLQAMGQEFDATSGEEMRLRDWHPIASAPKNRPILVIGLPPLWKGYPFVVRWDATLEGGEGWWRHMDPSLDALYSVSDSITHWSDYPVLPAALKGAE